MVADKGENFNPSCVHVQNKGTSHVAEKKRHKGLKKEKEWDKTFAQGRTVNPDNKEAATADKVIKMQESNLNWS